MNKWRDKILDGYSYKPVSSDKMVLLTGSGGITQFAEALEAQGVSDELIQASISVWIDGTYITLNNLIIQKNDNRN